MYVTSTSILDSTSCVIFYFFVASYIYSLNTLILLDRDLSPPSGREVATPYRPPTRPTPTPTTGRRRTFTAPCPQTRTLNLRCLAVGVCLTHFHSTGGACRTHRSVCVCVCIFRGTLKITHTRARTHTYLKDVVAPVTTPFAVRLIHQLHLAVK